MRFLACAVLLVVLGAPAPAYAQLRAIEPRLRSAIRELAGRSDAAWREFRQTAPAAQ